MLYIHFTMRRLLAFCVFVLLTASTGLVAQQKPVEDIAAVYAEGKTTGTTYKNAYFGLTLDVAPGEFTKGGFLSSEGKRARLIDAHNHAGNQDDRFEIAVLADLQAANPRVLSPDIYVRSVRHSFEREGAVTEFAEKPVTISGVQFTCAVVRQKAEGEVTHYTGIYSTFLNGYIFSIQASAGTPEKVEALVSRAVKLEPAGQ
jgi:hypothetical protein